MWKNCVIKISDYCGNFMYGKRFTGLIYLRCKKTCRFYNKEDDLNMDLYEMAFGLILNAGNSKSKSMMAIEAAREFEFEEAEKLVAEAEEDLRAAHQTQTDLIQGEARGEKMDLNLIMVHAQDHLTTAMIMIDQANEFINLYRLISELKK